MYLAALLSLALMAAPDEPLYESEFVFPHEPFHNHSSSIVETAKGDLLVCWFHGKGERSDDTLVISGSRKKKGAATWSAPFIMADNKDLPDQNCTMFIDPQGRLWMFWISAIDNLVRSYFLEYRISTNYEGDGAPVWEWQAPLFCRPKNADTIFTEQLEKRIEEAKVSPHLTPERREKRLKQLETNRAYCKDKLFQRLGWMPRQQPIMLNDKRMMLGLYSDTFDCSLFAFTEDGGQNWEFSEPLRDLGIQPSLVRKKNGNIVAYMRDAPLVRRAESNDLGMTWKEELTDIPNSGSSVAVLGLKSGNWILLVNDLPKGRHVLTAMLSDDEGKTWKWKRALENHEPEQGTGSYPTIIQTADGSIHATYTHQDQKIAPGETIRHVRLNEAWIKAGSKP